MNVWFCRENLGASLNGLGVFRSRTKHGVPILNVVWRVIGLVMTVRFELHGMPRAPRELAV